MPPEPRAVVAPVEQLLGEYREWLVCERALASVTVRASEQFARRFLAGRVSAGDPRGVLGITAGEVNAFLMRECARVSSGSVGCFTYRLRSLLRYLAFRGFVDPAATTSYSGMLSEPIASDANAHATSTASARSRPAAR